MKLEGGIDEYRWNKRYKDGEAPWGRKVIFINKNGWDYDLEHARRLLSEGDIVTVEEIYVGRSSSKVEFIEFPGETFNTVMFEDLE